MNHDTQKTALNQVVFSYFSIAFGNHISRLLEQLEQLKIL